MPRYEPEELETNLPEVPVSVTPVLRSSDYQDNIQDTQVNPISNVMMYVEGMSWEVDYYSQALGGDQVQSGQQVGGQPVFQQYTLVKGLEVKVSSPLDSSIEENQEFTRVGTAIVYAGLIPNIADMMVAQIGDGKLGVMEVTAVTRRSHMGGAVYEISYKVIDFFTDARKLDFESKVVRTFYFDQARIATSSNGLLTDTESTSIIDTESVIKDLLKGYMKTFYNDSLSTLVVPDSYLYDPHVNNVIIRMFQGKGMKSIRQLTPLVKSDDTIFTSLLRGRGITRWLSKVRKPTVGNVIHWATIFSKTARSVNVVTSAPLDALLTVLVPDVVLPLIVPVETDECYVFTNNFYTGDLPMSVLETITRNFMNGDAVPLDDVMLLVNDTPNWMIEDFYYYTPILLMLLKTFTKEV